MLRSTSAQLCGGTDMCVLNVPRLHQILVPWQIAAGTTHVEKHLLEIDCAACHDCLVPHLAAQLAANRAAVPVEGQRRPQKRHAAQYTSAAPLVGVGVWLW